MYIVSSGKRDGSNYGSKSGNFFTHFNANMPFHSSVAEIDRAAQG
jgi:hypothetical protein